MRNIAKLLLVLYVFVVFGIFSGCSGTLSQSDKDMFSVIRKNLDTAQEEKLEEHISTIHPNSPAYESTRRIMEQMFSLYDLNYELKDMKIIKKSKTEAEVEFIQVTKKKKGPDFRDNKVKGVHILKDYNGEWKIYNTIINNVEYLD